jgi:hypothetical protein
MPASSPPCSARSRAAGGSRPRQATLLGDETAKSSTRIDGEANLWAPQRPLPDQTGLPGHIDEIVRRGRMRGFIPWLVTQHPAVLHHERAREPESHLKPQ